MRKCEACGGPGPALYDDGQKATRKVINWHRYVCKNCHSNPEDPFFLTRDEVIERINRGQHPNE